MRVAFRRSLLGLAELLWIHGLLTFSLVLEIRDLRTYRIDFIFDRM